MTKEELEEVYYIEKEIEDLEKRTRRIKKQSDTVSDVVQNGYKRHAVLSGFDIIRQFKIEKNNKKMEEYKIQLEIKKNEIEDYIETIPFSEMRQIFRFRYLDNKNWVQVAHSMNEEYKGREYTENSVRCKHDRYLEKN